MSHFSCAVLGFGVGVNLSPLLNKFICLSVKGLEQRLIILGLSPDGLIVVLQQNVDPQR